MTGEIDTLKSEIAELNLNLKRGGEDREKETRVRAGERRRALRDEVLKRDGVVVDLVDKRKSRVGLGGGEHEGHGEEDDAKG